MTQAQRLLLLTLALGNTLAFADYKWVGPENFNDDLNDFRPAMKFYADGKGHEVAVGENSAKDKILGGGNQIYFFGDEKTMSHFDGRITANTNGDYTIEFNDLRISQPKIQTLQFHGDTITITCGGKSYSLDALSGDALAKARNSATFKPMPTARIAQTIMRDTETDEILFMDRDAHYPYTSHSRFFAGPQGEVKEFKILETHGRRDGTTTILTEAGTWFLSDTEFNHEDSTFSPKSSSEKHKLVRIAKGTVPVNYEKLLGKDLAAQLGDKPYPTPCDALFESKELVDSTKP